MVVALADVSDDAVAAHAVRARLVGSALTDDAEAVRVVHIEQRVVFAGQPSEALDVCGVPRHAVDAVDADESRRGVLLQKQPLEVFDILEGELLDRCATRGRELAAVVDRLVGPLLQENRSAAREHRDHRHVDQRDRREDQHVLRADQVAKALFDPRVEDRAAEKARPTRMRPPARQILGDGSDDLAIEVKTQVVAGGEVGEPLVADPDHPAVEVIDDSIRHRVRPLELGQVIASLQPAVDPPRHRTRGPGVTANTYPHEAEHRPQGAAL